MCACDPNSNSINIPIIPISPVPGFGIPTAPIQLPFPGVSLPTNAIQDLQELVNNLQLIFPSSTFKPTIDNYTKVVFDLISNLLTQAAPFLSLYNFFTPVLNLIVCIIEVICAIPNPFKISRAVSKLFKQCLPDFLKIFPWMALPSMIVSLLLLIVSLIQYLIDTISSIIEEIIRNINILSASLSFQDAESTLAAIQKLAELMCLIQNTLAILVALSSIMNIIQSLAVMGGKTICDDEDANGCCSSDVCPPFIRNSPLTGIGRLFYCSEIKPDVNNIFSGISGLPQNFNASVLNIASIRNELWQFVCTDEEQLHSFSEIFNSSVVYWPEGITYNNSTPPDKAAYVCDLTLRMNPSIFHSSDRKGEREFTIKNCIVTTKPYIGIINFDNQISLSNTTGTLSLQGGQVYESDGSPYLIDNKQASLNNFIHNSSRYSVSAPSVNDIITIDLVNFIFRPVHETLLGHQLITVGCLPEVRTERSVFNAVLIAEDVRAMIDKLKMYPASSTLPAGIFPNIQGAHTCALNSLTKFKSNITLETTAEFQSAITTCLNDLKDQTIAVIENVLSSAVSQFQSDVTLSTDLEFTTRQIEIKVVLKDAAGTEIGKNIPSESQAQIAALLKAASTLGTVSEFHYNHGIFSASLSSPVAGDGEVSVSFDNKIFSKIIETPSKIVENVLPYTFVDAAPLDETVRRTNVDVAGNGV